MFVKQFGQFGCRALDGRHDTPENGMLLGDFLCPGRRPQVPGWIDKMVIPMQMEFVNDPDRT